jgi:aryl-alcohol dehydrogenase-like predicted oxidoreductase
VRAARELAEVLPDGVSLPAASLAWVASRPGITSAIPGARNVTQAVGNADAAAHLDDAALLAEFDVAVHDVYDRLLRADIHPNW